MAFLIDTNVISELRKGQRCDENVSQWQKSISEPKYISVITLLEIRKGIYQQKRKDPEFAQKLEHWYHNKVKPSFAGRIFLVDVDVVEKCACLNEDLTRPYGDALIAATALVNGLTVVTRNTKHFADMDIPLINPWDYKED